MACILSPIRPLTISVNLQPIDTFHSTLARDRIAFFALRVTASPVVMDCHAMPRGVGGMADFEWSGGGLVDCPVVVQVIQKVTRRCDT